MRQTNPPGLFTEKGAGIYAMAGGMIARLRVFVILGMGVVTLALADGPAGIAKNPPSRIFNANGLPSDETFFPIAVWLQAPLNAPRYQAAGINLYVGLWDGPTAEQLSQLQKADMPVICEQTPVALASLDNPIIAGWMHGDEPDNAQSLGDGKGYGPPIAPDKIVRGYERIRSTDPSRPVMLNLGQGVAWEQWFGRGPRSNHPEDYAEYVKGCDIVSFDIYPVVHASPEVRGKLEFVARGVERLAGWTRGEKPVWSCIECTHIGDPSARATPQQVRAEVWMALCRGARGLIYFVHQFKPAFREAALLDDPEMLAAVTEINRQIRELAPMLNSPTIASHLTAQSTNAAAPIATLLKRRNNEVYLFAVNLANAPTRATFALHEMKTGTEAEVLGESRRLAVQRETFTDEFAPYAVHLYRLAP